MPCWFYDKKDLVNTPSCRDGISPETEAWYRKEGAKHIMDAGNKLGLRFDTCATGVVYFHRFYMFHSFKEFHRLVTAACCLFLAGKVEETPKKCKDIIKTFRSMLNDAQFAHFGEDAKEEVMTLERILLQTIKFDLMVEHPYAYLLKFAKLVKGDKAKIQKMVQMAWTFINDSLCTTLCLQWEPEIVAVAVMYLTSRLNKFEITDWQGRPLGYRGKWYEFLVEDVTLELLEDICHQVLDLYSNAPQPQKDVASSPVPVKVRQPQISSDDDQSRTPRTPKSPHGVKRPAPSAAASAGASVPGSSQQTEADVMPPAAKDRERLTTHTESVSASSRAASNHSVPPMTSALPTAASAATAATAATAAVPMVGAPVTSFSNANPYMPSQMYSSSFMSTEGSQSIQSLMGTEAGAAASREEQGQASQGRYPNTGSVAYQQQYPGLNVAQQYPSAPSNQSSSGSSAGAHRSDYSSSSGAASASGSYRTAAVGGYQTGSQSSTPFSQQQYTSYQQPPPSMQSFPESGSASYGGPAYSSGVSQSQYPSASTGSSQSSSPLYQNFGGTRSAAPPFGSQGTTVAAQQQQRYQPSNQSVPIGNSGFQAAGGAGFQSQLSSSTGFQNQQGSSSASYSSGGYPGRTGASAGYSAEQPSSSSGSFHQSSQQSYSGREQLSGNNYQGQQPGYQQPPGNIRSSGQGGQQQGSSSNRGQNWSY